LQVEVPAAAEVVILVRQPANPHLVVRVKIQEVTQVKMVSLKTVTVAVVEQVVVAMLVATAAVYPVVTRAVMQDIMDLI
jgi:hypothetical protein